MKVYFFSSFILVGEFNPSFQGIMQGFLKFFLFCDIVI